ncbi:hypothetical protein V9T40_008838 [Parthenolecanium corni]|uniref:Uncharacterized protein n=1 Tax=Parthenolecanium corni TaxID=536013 RepID=A0AAN9Y889_9HEMI
MAEEANAAKVAPSSQSARAASNHGTGGGHQQLEEVDSLMPSPNDANPSLLADNPDIYQADVVEGETTTTEKPTEGGAAPDTAASPAAPAAPAEGAAAPAAPAEGGATPATPAEAGATETSAAPAEGEATPASPATADTPASPAAAGSPAAPPEGGAAGGGTAEGAEGKSPEGEASAAGTAETTTAPGGAETSGAPAGGVTTSVGPVTGSPTTKDPYAIDIPLDKKINKRTQRKLWEEIEKRKPLVPKHVALHIQKYAKPPFETWGCKSRGKGSCSGCK